MNKEKLETGTTTVGFLIKDGVILASESKSTMGYLVSSKTAKKVFKIDDRMAMTTAGGVGDTQTLLRLIKAEINLYKLTHNTELTVKAVTTLLSNILQGNKFFPYMAMLIIGGVDKAGNHIYSLDPVGGLEENNFIATGSGSPIAYGVLESMYKKGLTKEEGIDLAIKAIKSAKERDVFSGGKEIQIVVIDKSGIETIIHEK
jgi:proteasome beta subunit